MQAKLACFLDQPSFLMYNILSETYSSFWWPLGTLRTRLIPTALITTSRSYNSASTDMTPLFWRKFGETLRLPHGGVGGSAAVSGGSLLDYIVTCRYGISCFEDYVYSKYIGSNSISKYLLLSSHTKNFRNGPFNNTQSIKFLYS